MIQIIILIIILFKKRLSTFFSPEIASFFFFFFPQKCLRCLISFAHHFHFNPFMYLITRSHDKMSRKGLIREHPPIVPNWLNNITTNRGFLVTFYHDDDIFPLHLRFREGIRKFWIFLVVSASRISRAVRFSRPSWVAAAFSYLPSLSPPSSSSFVGHWPFSLAHQTGRRSADKRLGVNRTTACSMLSAPACGPARFLFFFVMLSLVCFPPLWVSPYE